MTGKRVLPLVFGFFAILLCAGCVKLGESSELPLAAVEPTAVPGDRINCQEILGTAFRSATERAWFSENCSKWPLVKVADEPAPGAPQPAEPPECAVIRGKPYESSQQRNWYLQNCGPGANQAAAAPTAATPNPQQPTPVPQSPTNTPVPPSAGPDRTDCDAIRGTPYRSAAERNWYAQNCANSPAPAAPPAPAPRAPAPPAAPPPGSNTTAPAPTGPDRADCGAIRGSNFRSEAERIWYSRYCS